MRAILFGLIIILLLLIYWSIRGPIVIVRRKKQQRTTEEQYGPEKMVRCLQILEVKSHASEEEITQAYRDLANVWHPDRFAANPRLQKKAEEKLKEVNEAYQYIQSFYK